MGNFYSATSLTSDVRIKERCASFCVCGRGGRRRARRLRMNPSVEAAVAEQWTEEIETAPGMARDGEGYDQIASTAADIRVDEQGP